MIKNGAKTEDSGVTPSRRAVLLDAANALADARRTKVQIAELPAELRPQTMAEAYVIQDELALAYGKVGGWKVGAPSADATPGYAPMPAVWMAATGAEIRSLCYRGLEAEVAFLLGRDLPVRDDAYDRDEVFSAITSCHPAIEVLESAFVDPTAVDKLSMIGDLQMNGGFVYGPAYDAWRDVDFSKEAVSLAVDGIIRVERTGSNTAGDLTRLLPWLANEGAVRTGGLRAGQWVTTGSWTGNTIAEKRSKAHVRFATLGEVNLSFAPEQELERGLPGTTRSFT